jgi:hypothetical protein
MGIASSVLLSAALLTGFGTGSRETRDLYVELGTRMAAAGHPLDIPGMRVISNFPIWVAETQRVSTLALPDEPPEDVLDLANTFPGTRYLILTSPEGSHWPADLRNGAAGADCFRPLDLGTSGGSGRDPLASTTVYEVGCAGGAP